MDTYVYTVTIKIPANSECAHTVLSRVVKVTWLLTRYVEDRELFIGFVSITFSLKYSNVLSKPINAISLSNEK